MVASEVIMCVRCPWMRIMQACELIMETKWHDPIYSHDPTAFVYRKRCSGDMTAAKAASYGNTALESGVCNAISMSLATYDDIVSPRPSGPSLASPPSKSLQLDAYRRCSFPTSLCDEADIAVLAGSLPSPAYALNKSLPSIASNSYDATMIEWGVV